MPTPQTEAELLARMEACAGRTLGDLATQIGIDVPTDLRRAKGWIGQLVEQIIGTGISNKKGPDLAELGIEIKTLPIGIDQQPRESTFVCAIHGASLLEQQWAQSEVRNKLACVLWVPVQAEGEVHARRLGLSWLWRANQQEEELLRHDWETIVDFCALHGLGNIEATLGEALQVRPKATDSHARAIAVDGDGGIERINPRGFYLRRSFTARLLQNQLRC